ncbi:CopD family protein [Bradymonas sediminis]|uniref:Protoporphyrinogen IX oxidase n=1 Tax=Bradymonas sediminis TaxID=1548548 RepID=A0A2Z4FQD9_9DELT|nr:CopD family protein [Bradymonas sediminis]AWV90854.1 hypothetical protein DN745_16615 [Bradymonas sediminis]TDP75409.1 putative membrane protein [Bradymonas sediminis]
MHSSWFLAFHIIGIIMWMGGLFGLTMHAAIHTKLKDAPLDEMAGYETKSYFMGALPGMILTVGAGLALLFGNPAGVGYFLKADGIYGTTFHVKLLLVVILIVIDQVFLYKMRTFHKNGVGNRKAFMAMHGSIGLCFIIIVILMMTRVLA